MKNESEVRRLKQDENEKFLRRIRGDGLVRTLDIFSGQKPRIIGTWPKPHFSATGIYLTPPETSLELLDGMTNPSFLFATADPLYALVMVAKAGTSHYNQEKMVTQLQAHQRYVSERPGKLSDFLAREGISPKEIERMRIGFSGVFPTRNGRRLREAHYHEFSILLAPPSPESYEPK
ncbi:MAG: hypothetical protein ABIH92_02875 [Nanoarchaeota archaeon]